MWAATSAGHLATPVRVLLAGSLRRRFRLCRWRAGRLRLPIGGGFVIGARKLFDWTSNSKSGTFATTALGGLAATADFENQWFDTLTARIGYAVQPNWLLYFQGGGAWAHTTTSVTVISGGTQFGGQTSNTRSGWTIGGGVEWMFTALVGVSQGNYMDLDAKSGTVVTPALTACLAGCPISAKATESNVLVGVNYRFF